MMAREKGRGKRDSRSMFVIEYFKSLKPWETEELVNQYFNRPIAYLVAKVFKRLRASPNFVTMISMCFGVSSGFFFSKGDYRSDLIAAALLELMVIFDCADGQLARILGKSSQLGKTMDGLADMMTHLSIFYGVAYSLSAKVGSIYPYFLAVVAQASMYLHIMFYDHFKNMFINVTYTDHDDRLESLEKLREQAVQAKVSGKGPFGRLLPGLLYSFYKVENSVVSIGYLPPLNNFSDLFPDPERIDPYVKEVYYMEMRPAVRMWSFLGDTLHLSFFIACGLYGRMYLLFPTIIVLLNIYMVVVIIFQRHKFKKLGLEREIIWQGRLDWPPG